MQPVCSTLASQAQRRAKELAAGRLALGLAAAALVIYALALPAPFIFDDYLNLVRQPQIETLWPTASSWRESRPVGFMTFALNYAATGLSPAGFRLVNVLLHASCAVLLFQLVRETLAAITSDWLAQRSKRIAGCAALLWLVHPLHTAAVTCIVQRFEVLMALFSLATLYLLRVQARAPHKFWWGAAAVGAFWLGIGCKEVTAACLPVALLYDRLFLTQSWRRTARERGWCYLGMALALVWLGWVISLAYAPGANATAGFGMKGVSAWGYLRSQPAVLLHYLRLTFWPDVLCLDYGWPVETSAWRIYGLGAVIVALLGVSLALLWFRPGLGFLGLSTFLILGPTSSIMPIADLAFEHRMYLPLAPLAVLVVLALERLADPLFTPTIAGKCVLTVVAVAALLLSGRTVLRNIDFRDPAVIWKQALAVNPRHARSHFLLGDHYLRTGQLEPALAAYQGALAVRPSYIAAHNNAALTLARLGRTDDALAQFQQARTWAPDDPGLRFNQGAVLQRAERWEEARAAFQEVLRISPQNAAARRRLAELDARAKPAQPR